MTYLSICSGIEAATVAWHPLGWKPLAFSEIEKFPSAVLAHHWPDVPNLGDMTRYANWPAFRPELIVAGSPCQSFSVAGLRKGLADPRGNLTLTYLAIVARYRPAWVVWENVPGVLSDRTGAFGALTGGLAKLGYGWAFRVLDAKHYGVPQRRRRVFLVGYLGDWRRAGAVLFESHSMQGHPPPGGEAREIVAAITADGVGTCGADDNQAQAGHLIAYGGNNTSGPVNVATACNAKGGSGRMDFESETFVVQQPIPFDLAQITSAKNRTRAEPGLPSPTLVKCSNMHVAAKSIVRRLTPRECERLQGFPDDHTSIPWRGKSADRCPDGPRYKAIGNSMAVPVMRWIGERINLIEKLSIPEVP